MSCRSFVLGDSIFGTFRGHTGYVRSARSRDEERHFLEVLTSYLRINYQAIKSRTFRPPSTDIKIVEVSVFLSGTCFSLSCPSIFQR
jgi:hypothetical protein